MPDIKFSCTMCGRCCHNHSIPLTWDEAISWLEEGGKVDIYCEADPWPGEPPKEDLRAAHRERRSFPVRCGSSRVRVTTLFVAVVSGPCKNLGEDLKCRIYERRPLVCRIYPAEINPFIRFNIAGKACPPEAWVSGKLMIAGGGIVDPEVQSLIEKSRQTDQDDVPLKALLCGHLGLDVAALAGEGFAVYAPGGKTLLDALRVTRAADPNSLRNDKPWRLYSPSLTTAESLRATGLDLATKEPWGDRYSFLSGPSMRAADVSQIFG